MDSEDVQKVEDSSEHEGTSRLEAEKRCLKDENLIENGKKCRLDAEICLENEEIKLRIKKIESEIEIIRAENKKMRLKNKNEKMSVETEEMRLETMKFRAETEEMRLETMKFRAETEEIRLESMKIRAETEKILAELDLKRNLTNYMATFKSRSNSKIFSDYTKIGTLTDCEDLDLPQVNNTNLDDAWKEIMTKLSILDDGKNEKTQVHPFVESILETIIRKFDLSKIKFHNDSRLLNPRYSPDFSITSSRITEASWPDCLSFIKCKSTDIPVSEGSGQTISYLTHLSIPDSLDDSEIRELTFSAQTNGREIQFFIFKKVGQVIKNYYTSELNLLGSDGEINVPSKGFEILCRFMLFIDKSPISVDSLIINGSSYDIIKTFQKTRSFILGLIDLGGEEGRCVAKYALNQIDIACAIEQEAFNYKILENSPVKTLKLSTKSNSNCLLFLDVGKGDLRSWTNDIIYADLKVEVEIDFKKVIRCFIEIFDQIKVLHDFGYTHGDIKPANILILNDDKPCLIDLVTVSGKQKIFIWHQGTLLFMAEDILRKKGTYIYKCKYDMESLFYSFLDCADAHFSKSFFSSCIDIDFDSSDPKFNDQIFADSRKTRLADLRASKDPSHFKYPKFVDLFFQLFDKLADIPGDLNEKHYHEFRQILESFLAI